MKLTSLFLFNLWGCVLPALSKAQFAFSSTSAGSAVASAGGVTAVATLPGGAFGWSPEQISTEYSYYPHQQYEGGFNNFYHPPPPHYPSKRGHPPPPPPHHNGMRGPPPPPPHHFHGMRGPPPPPPHHFDGMRGPPPPHPHHFNGMRGPPPPHHFNGMRGPPHRPEIPFYPMPSDEEIEPQQFIDLSIESHETTDTDSHKDNEMITSTSTAVPTSKPTTASHGSLIVGTMRPPLLPKPHSAELSQQRDIIFPSSPLYVHPPNQMDANQLIDHRR